MKRIAIIATCSVSLIFTSLVSDGQNNLSVSVPMIWSNVAVKDNWTPPTAPNYKKYLKGSALGYGINVNYSFQPKFIIKNNRFKINIGTGYFKQEFEIRRPFDYASPLEPIYRTRDYTYYNWLWSGGVSYDYPIKKYLIMVNISYSQLTSFRQEYTPTINHQQYIGFYTQVNKHSIDFAKMTILAWSVQRGFRDKVYLGIGLILPYTFWRNDKIFGDNPTKFYRPDLSIGSSFSVTYHFKGKGSKA